MDIISGSLSEDVRRTLILFYFDEMSTKDIAEALGVPEQTLYERSRAGPFQGHACKTYISVRIITGFQCGSRNKGCCISS